MDLYLVQHGEATSEEENPKRPLTEKGRKDVAKIGSFLKRCGVKIDVIWHSQKTRAIETAGLLSREILPKNGTEQKGGLAPNEPVDKIFNDIKHENRNLMLVGHLPFLQKLASLVLTNLESFQIIGFRQGGVVCLQQRDDGIWQIIFEIIPELLK